MLMTRHARTRMQQRSIPPIVISWLSNYGEEGVAPGGATVLYFSKRSRKRMKSDMGKVIYNKVKSFLNTYLVLDKDKILTTGRQHKRIYLQAIY